MPKTRKSFSVDVEENLSDAFSKKCSKEGFHKYRAVETALKIFLSLPDEVQVALYRSRNNSDVYKSLIHRLRDIELTKNLQALTPEQRMVLIELAKEGSKRLFPKQSKKK